MTTPGDFEELEPLDEGTSVGTLPGQPPMPSVQELLLQGHKAGLPAPAHNPRADKIYFKFLLAGLLMLIGCFMPFGPDWQMAGYKTISGGLFLIIALGVCWASWGAIHANRLEPKRMKWILLAFIPFLVELMNLLNCANEPAIKDAIAANVKIPQSAGGFFESLWGCVPLVNDDAMRRESGVMVDNFVRYFGTGKLFILVGALLAELFFVASIFGATKVLKQQKAAAMAARRAPSA